MDYGYSYGYDYRYDYPGSYYGSDEKILTAVLSIYLIILTVVLVFVLVSYIFHSIGLYTIGKRMGREHAWLAFIPFARDYFHGELAGEIILKNRRIRNPGIWKLVLPIIAGVVTGGFSTVMILSFSILVFAEGMRGVGSGIMMVIVLLLLVSILMLVYNAVYLVLRVLIDMQIFGKFTTHNMAVVHSVLSVILPLYEALCLFVMRNRPFLPGDGPEAAIPPIPPSPSEGPEQVQPPVPPAPSEDPEQVHPPLEAAKELYPAAAPMDSQADTGTERPGEPESAPPGAKTE